MPLNADPGSALLSVLKSLVRDGVGGAVGLVPVRTEDVAMVEVRRRRVEIEYKGDSELRIPNAHSLSQ